MEKHYDIGMLGFWDGTNYGSILNGYATYVIFKQLGYTVSPLGLWNTDLENGEHNSRFIKKYYDVQDILNLDRFKKTDEANNLCDTVCILSDQTWNWGISYGGQFFLPWVKDNVRRISFCTSFGHSKEFVPEDKKEFVASSLRRMNSVSVREKFSQDILYNNYGIKSILLFEPVFYVDRSVFEKIAEGSSFNETEPYILTYILDPTPEKRNLIVKQAEKLGLKVYNILDAGTNKEVYEKNRKTLDLPNVLAPDIETFLKAYINAKYVITDSFHGTAFSIIFKKNFISIGNRFRGIVRFDELLGRFNLSHHYLLPENLEPNTDILSKEQDWSFVDEYCKSETVKAFDWLKAAIQVPVTELVEKDEARVKEITRLSEIEKKKVVNKPAPANKIFADTERCKITVALIKNFGIKHIVISAGTRNITLNRLFEANQDFFKVYYVTDERSAGFFALGLATKLKEIVCICCTSGTSVCNYVSPVTEALYQRVPLLVLTSDRYPELLERQEQQTVDQISVLSSAVKKSFSLVSDMKDVKPRLTACTVSEALYEIGRGGNGPVQLNVPIREFHRHNPPEDSLILPKARLTKRITAMDEKLLSECAEYLKTKKKILVIVNQQTPPNEKLKQLFIDFASKYNCALYVDHFSNISNDYTVFHGEEQLKDDNLSPDLVINFGEERTNISPGINLLKCSEYWRINEDGKFTNKYFILSNVFECSIEFFMQYFSENAKENINDKIYLNSLKESKKSLFGYDFSNWGMKYTIGSLIKNMPENSLFHIARSLTVRYVHNFDKLPNGVEVYCNSGVNGIDGCSSTFMGQVAAAKDEELAFLCIGDLAFFYDMNSLWNKSLKGNTRIMLNNNAGAGLLSHLKSPGAEHYHATTAK
ncbi:MAG: polysaccharide pyruvyl transferase family protein, partial [Oscillospiraceae bacterium]|nr:polysaccharide pyruvyl transferase family protein [Oscillospiraceae bacterium]